MADMMMGWKRTSMCGSVNEAMVGQTATVMGWVDTRRDLGSLIFIDLRDREGIIQCVFDRSAYSEDFEKVESLRSEYVVAIQGRVEFRSEETRNPKLATGMIEIKAEDMRLLSVAQTTPFYIQDGVNVREDLRLKYRYLDLRRPEMQRNLILRSRIAQVTRNYLADNGFLEVETPILTKSTPEGARDYLVPSRVQPGKFYALPQSPQQFKQLLMVSGIDRYFQIARCFRDEDLRADRQPEFTQIDMEMSFVTPEDIMTLNEGLIQSIFKEAWDMELPAPFLRITYAEAMDRFGSDKPDTRFEMELKDISDIVADSEFKVFTGAIKAGGSVRGINVKNGAAQMARRELDSLVDYVKGFGARGMAWINVREYELQSPLTKFFDKETMDRILARMGAEVGDILMFISDADNEVVFDALGHLRLHLGEKLGLIDHEKLHVLWVTEFPLLEYSHEDKRWVAKHHPFTAPMDEDLDLLETEPQKVRAKAYDLVINGMEAGGGSCRIHTVEMQEKMFKLLGFTEEEAWARFGYLMDAFKYGAPPHGGLAFGFDRLSMILSKVKSIRDVIAFPKVQSGTCLLTGGPDVVDEYQLEELHIRSTAENEE